jgi:vacuolar-type H+-ATPase subunit I/STV1
MARKPPSTQPQPANLSIEQIRAAVRRLEKRLAELQALDVEKLTDQDEDVVLGDLVRRIDDTLMSVYGSDTQDYHRYSIGGLDDSPLIMGGGWPSVAQRRPAIRSAVARAVSTLQSAISILKERIDDSGETGAARAVRAYSGLDLHKDIARASSKLYQDGHYANAVEAAVKALNNLVRLHSQLDIDGTSLMERAFNPNNPLSSLMSFLISPTRTNKKGS